MSIKNVRLEVMQFLEKNIDTFVQNYLIPVETIWQPSDLLPDSRNENFLEEVRELQEYAKDARLNVFTPSGKKVSEEIINLEGMDTVFARALAQMEVVTLEDLAECATDDLSDIPGFEAEKVGKIILAARNLTWFKDEQ